MRNVPNEADVGIEIEEEALEPTIEGTVSPPFAAEEAECSRSGGEIRNLEQDDTESRLSDGPWEPSSGRLYTMKKEAGRDIGNGTFQ